MKDNSGVLEADISYAVRMVRTGFFTPEQAAQTCGVSLPVLQARLVHNTGVPAITQRWAVRSRNTWVPV